MKDPPQRNSPDHKTTRLTESELFQETDFTATLSEWNLYRVERLLGVGGMARVYLAFDKRLLAE